MVKSNSVEDNNGREPPIYNSSKKKTMTLLLSMGMQEEFSNY